MFIKLRATPSFPGLLLGYYFACLIHLNEPTSFIVKVGEKMCCDNFF